MEQITERQQRLIDTMTEADIDSVHWVKHMNANLFTDREVARELIKRGWCPPTGHKILVADHAYFDDQEQEMAECIEKLEKQLEIQYRINGIYAALEEVRVMMEGGE